MIPHDRLQGMLRPKIPYGFCRLPLCMSATVVNLTKGELERLHVKRDLQQRSTSLTDQITEIKATSTNFEAS